MSMLKHKSLKQIIKDTKDIYERFSVWGRGRNDSYDIVTMLGSIIHELKILAAVLA